MYVCMYNIFIHVQWNLYGVITFLGKAECSGMMGGSYKRGYFIVYKVSSEEGLGVCMRG